jgi:hypothetical protein
MKRMFILGLVVTMSVTLFAGRKQQVWIVDDFESYGNTENMLAGPFVGLESLADRGWWDSYSLQQILEGGDPTPLSPYTMTLGIGDPNDGFSAEGEIKDHPTDPNEHGMVIHFQSPADGSWGQLNPLLLAHNMGIPTHKVDTPLGPFDAADLTQFDKVQFKIKKLAGNITDPVESTITITFTAPDLGTTGYYTAQHPGGILASSEDVWEIMEFDLSAPLQAPHAEYGLDNVIGFLFGIEDENNADVTFIIDDIILYSESEECPEYLAADINGDCTVDMGDLAAIGSQWLK